MHIYNKSTIENKERFLKADNQSNKVLKKNNLRSSVELSVSSKLLLFLSPPNAPLQAMEDITIPSIDLAKKLKAQQIHGP